MSHNCLFIAWLFFTCVHMLPARRGKHKRSQLSGRRGDNDFELGIRLCDDSASLTCFWFTPASVCTLHAAAECNRQWSQKWLTAVFRTWHSNSVVCSSMLIRHLSLPKRYIDSIGWRELAIPAVGVLLRDTAVWHVSDDRKMKSTVACMARQRSQHASRRWRTHGVITYDGKLMGTMSQGYSTATFAANAINISLLMCAHSHLRCSDLEDTVDFWALFIAVA
jgi:hypothetical protein